MKARQEKKMKQMYQERDKYVDVKQILRNYDTVKRIKENFIGEFMISNIDEVDRIEIIRDVFEKKTGVTGVY